MVFPKAIHQKAFYGPSKPHSEHLYVLAVFLQWKHLIMADLPQSGQRNSTKSFETSLLQVLHFFIQPPKAELIFLRKESFKRLLFLPLLAYYTAVCFRVFSRNYNLSVWRQLVCHHDVRPDNSPIKSIVFNKEFHWPVASGLR